MPYPTPGTPSQSPVNRVYVNNSNYASVLGNGNAQSNIEYFLEEIVDVGDVSITPPVGGLSITGYNFNLSALTSSEPGFTLFSGGSTGDFLFNNFFISVTGVGSQVYDITGATGDEAFEINNLNYIGCSSLGTIDGYRQGLENGTGRFGGQPQLTLAGTWLGGYFIDASIVRGMTDGAFSLFSAGTGFTMNSRFRSNMNVDLPASASYLDFAPANFPNPSTLQMHDGLVTRNGVQDAQDSNLTPNISKADLASDWILNVGLGNTNVGGRLTISTAVTTVINTQDVFEVLAGTTTATELEHFDSPVSGQLRHLATDPITYRFDVDHVIDGPNNDLVTMKVTRFNDETQLWEDVLERQRQVNNLLGARDVAFFNFNGTITLRQDDIIRLEIANNSGTGNLTSELNGVLTLERKP